MFLLITLHGRVIASISSNPFTIHNLSVVLAAGTAPSFFLTETVDALTQNASGVCIKENKN